MKLNLREIILFPILSVIMLISKLLMEFLPNCHLLGVLIVTFTVVFRWKALIPIYIYVFLNGLVSGFNVWWVPYLYIWTVLWATAMLIPRFKTQYLNAGFYIAVCALHGFLFGILYAPVQALLFGLDFKGTLTWIIAGLPFDVIHGISNFFCGMLIIPIIKVLQKTK